MKIYKKGSAAYNRQKKTQKDQAAADARPKKPLDQHRRKYLHPERHRDYLDKMERKLVRKYTNLLRAD